MEMCAANVKSKSACCRKASKMENFSVELGREIGKVA